MAPGDVGYKIEAAGPRPPPPAADEAAIAGMPKQPEAARGCCIAA